MVSKDESVELCVVMDKEHIGPILLFQNMRELALVVPNRRGILVPLDRGAVGFEAWASNI